jgi:hypothetical protein
MFNEFHSMLNSGCPVKETRNETRFSIITIVDKYVVVEIQIQATNYVTMCNVNHE